MHKYFSREKNRILTRAAAYDLLKCPYVTEKTNDLLKANKLVLKVALNANKIDIKRAVEIVFQLRVESINTMITKSRLRSFKGKMGKRAVFKKAIVSINKDSDISNIIGEA